MATITSPGTFLSDDLFSGYSITADGLETETATTLRWNMAFPSNIRPPMTVTLSGTGFVLDAEGRPTAGTLTSVTLILDRFAFPQPTAEITGISLPLVDVLSNARTGTIDGDVLLAAALAGADTLTLGDASTGFGDRLELTSGSQTSGADTITLTGEDGNAWGDLQSVETTELVLNVSEGRTTLRGGDQSDGRVSILLFPEGEDPASGGEGC